MKTIIFNGIKFASRKEKDLKKKFMILAKRGIKPYLVSILIGESASSRLFLKLKKKACQRMRAEMKTLVFPAQIPLQKCLEVISQLNRDKAIQGIMVQLPLPKNYILKDRNTLIQSIKPGKDIDGMRKDSNFTTPVVKAVYLILQEALQKLHLPDSANLQIAVVGSRGFVGGKIIKFLTEKGYSVSGLHGSDYRLSEKLKKAEVIVSATGRERLIKGDMVKKGSIIIDVGSPKGDVIGEEIIGKAAFYSPVPGGVGPVTIACLLENLLNPALIEK